MSALEARIVAALADEDNTASNDLAALLDATEAAIIEADATADREREKAFDPSQSPDPVAARQAMEDATFAANRLRTLLPRLAARYQKVLAAEQNAAWDGDYQTVQAQVEEVAHRFAVYPELVNELVAIFVEAQEVDREVNRINAAAPAGQHRRLRHVELVARGLDRHDRDHPALSGNLKLPDWQRSETMAWPPPQHWDTSLFAPAPFDRRYSADWAAAREEEQQAMRAEQERIAAYYEEQQRAQKKRMEAGR